MFFLSTSSVTHFLQFAIVFIEKNHQNKTLSIVMYQTGAEWKKAVSKDSLFKKIKNSCLIARKYKKSSPKQAYSNEFAWVKPLVRYEKDVKRPLIAIRFKSWMLEFIIANVWLISVFQADVKTITQEQSSFLSWKMTFFLALSISF